MDVLDTLLLVAAFALILLGAELFTNGIEWVGRKLDLAEGAVGSVLAAVGTALPETMIPLVAIVLGARDGHASTTEGIGVGAILGAPFMLATLAMFVTGTAVLLRTRRSPGRSSMLVDTEVLWKDVRYFAVTYGLAIGAAFLPAGLAWLKVVMAAVLLALYVMYVRAHLAAEASAEAEDPAPLRFHRLDRQRDQRGPRLRLINLQVLVALGAIVGGAVVFVDAVEHLAVGFGVDPTIMALVVAPIATELPEKFNSVIWIRQWKDTLALGNITGAMVFQSCIPTVVALILAADAWTVRADSALSFLSAGIAFASMAAIFGPMAVRGRLTGRGLMVGGGFYLGYLAAVGLSVAGVV
jgi:cation:H+ antiporter